MNPDYIAEIERGYPWFTYPQFYDWLAERCRDVVEVGSWKGFSTAHLAKALKRRPDRGWLHAVDVWHNAGAYWGDFQKRFPGDTGEHLYQTFLTHLMAYDVQDVVIPYRMPSLIAATVFKAQGKMFDAVFIDGDHSYAAVRSDILAWLPLVRPGGILAGHDYNNRHVRRAVDELLPAVNHAEGHVWWVTV